MRRGLCCRYQLSRQLRGISSFGPHHFWGVPRLPAPHFPLSSCYNSALVNYGLNGLNGLFHSQKHKALGTCTKLPRRLTTNLRYETKPSRPVVGNTKLGELYWVLSDNKTSLQDFAVRAKTDRKNKFRQRKFLKEKGRKKIIEYNITPYDYFMSEYNRLYTYTYKCSH